MNNQPPYLRIRRVPEAKPEDMTWSELEAAIGRGEIGPDVLVWSEIATHDQWWTIDNLRLFHDNSPAHHPPGEHLAAKLRTEERRREQGRCAADQEEAYRHGDLIEQSFGLRPLTEIVAQPGVLGATRFFVLPSFAAEQVCTLVFTTRELRVDVAVGPTSLWYSIPQFVSRKTQEGLWQETAGIPFDQRRVRHDGWKVKPKRTPQPFQSWEQARTAVEAAPDSQVTMLDGIGYRHKLQDAVTTLDVRWDNPDPRQHIAQRRIILAYWWLVPELAS